MKAPRVLRFSLRTLFIATLITALGLAACQLANLRFPFVYTGRALDVAIDGAGYFQIAGEDDDEPVYFVRKARFWIDDACQIRLGAPAQRLWLYPKISLPCGSQATIDAAGNVDSVTPESSETYAAGSFELAYFANPDGLKEHFPGVYRATSEAGHYWTCAPGSEPVGTCSPGWLELSDKYRQESAFSIPPAIIVAFAIGGGAGWLICSCACARRSAHCLRLAVMVNKTIASAHP